MKLASWVTGSTPGGAQSGIGLRPVGEILVPRASDNVACSAFVLVLGGNMLERETAKQEERGKAANDSNALDPSQSGRRAGRALTN